jgi:peroxiredoxin
MRIAALVALCATVFADDKPEVGKVVADLAIKSMDGKEIKLSDFRANKEKKAEGSITVIYFWSYKCPSGAPVLPKVKEFVEKVAGEKSGVQFVAISAYGEKADDVTKYVKDNEIKYTLSHDGEKAIAKALAVKQVNTTFVMDRDGKLIYRGGFDDAEAAVKAIKEGKAAPESDKKFQG